MEEGGKDLMVGATSTVSEEIPLPLTILAMPETRGTGEMLAMEERAVIGGEGEEEAMMTEVMEGRAVTGGEVEEEEASMMAEDTPCPGEDRLMNTMRTVTSLAS